MVLATDTHTNKQVALKVLRKDWIWKNDMGTLVQREIDIFKSGSLVFVAFFHSSLGCKTRVAVALQRVHRLAICRSVG